MVVATRLKELRESKKLSQGDIEQRTGLLRNYLSRVENGHTVPSVETLQKLAHALEVPTYQLFHDGEPSLEVRQLNLEDRVEWGLTGQSRDYFSRLRSLLAKMDSRHRKLILDMAQQAAKTSRAA